MKVLTLNTTTTESTVSVSGTAEDGVLAVGISIFDKTGTERIAVRTASVVDNKYEYTVDGLSKGEYQVCVADFDGGDCKTATVTLAAEEKKEDDESAAGTPETGYHTIKTEEVTPEANASMSSPALYISLAIGAIVAVVLAFGIRHVFAKRTK